MEPILWRTKIKKMGSLINPQNRKWHISSSSLYIFGSASIYQSHIRHMVPFATFEIPKTFEKPSIVCGYPFCLSAPSKNQIQSGSSNWIQTTNMGASSGWCRWRKISSTNGIATNYSTNINNRTGIYNTDDTCSFWSFSSFFFFSFCLLALVGTLYGKYMLVANVRCGVRSPVLGCQEDNEGSWAIGVFYGHSPFSLKPIEDVSHLLYFINYC